MTDGRNAFFAANTAARRNGTKTLRRLEFNFGARRRGDDYDVVPISRAGGPRKINELIRRSNYSLGKEKAGGQLLVSPWCPHRCRDSLASDPYLERFLDCQVVALIFELSIRLSPNDLTQPDSVFFHCFDGDVIMIPVEICHIYISRGHNFVGHYGLEPDVFPAIEVPKVECVTGRGLVGDRYFDFNEDYKGQITFFSLDVFDELCASLQVKEIPPSAVRRNVFTRNADLNKLVGRDFEVQGVHFYGTEESRPCDWMNRAVAPGAKKFLKGQGGLRARILTDGFLYSSARVLEAAK